MGKIYNFIFISIVSKRDNFMSIDSSGDLPEICNIDYIKNNSYAHGAWTFPQHFVGSPWICHPFPWEYLLPVGSLTIVIIVFTALDVLFGPENDEADDPANVNIEIRPDQIRVENNGIPSRKQKMQEMLRNLETLKRTLPRSRKKSDDYQKKQEKIIGRMINAIGLIGGILMILALKLNCQEILMAASVLIIFHGFAMLFGFFSLILKMDDKEGVFWSFLFIALEIPVLVLTGKYAWEPEATPFRAP